jgi:nucleoside 2-deoxyribosyltransferase
MKITICGSMKVYSRILSLKTKLENLGNEVIVPAKEGLSIDYSLLSQSEQIRLKAGFIKKYLPIIKNCDLVLVANFDLESGKNYIGSNTFLEMAFAFALDIPIYILHSIPDQNNWLEIAGMSPICLESDLSILKKNQKSHV